jgi:hypothetical protein
VINPTHTQRRTQAEIPPHSETDEAAVLGSILLAPDCLAESQKAGITARSFHLVNHRLIFLALEGMERDGVAINDFALRSYLDSRKQLADAGGFAYILTLPDFTPSAANLQYHIGIVVEKQREREFAELCRDGLKAVNSGADWPVVADDFKNRLDSIMAGPTGKNELPAIDNANDLIADEKLELPPEIIEGVLHRGLKGVLGSGSKARKTWILLDAAVSVATGLPWLNWRTLKGRVLYINFEIPREFIRSRCLRLAKAKGVDDLSNLDVWTLRGHGAALKNLLPRLLAKIEAGKVVLIIVDPIYKLLGGRDENSAGDIGELCNELEQIAVKTGAAVLYAAHFSKGNQAGKEAIDRIGGSGVWTRDADSIVTLTKHKEENAYTVDLILRNLPEVAPFVVKWKFPLMELDGQLNPEQLKQASGRKQEHDENDLLCALPDGGLNNKDWKAKARDEHGISERTFYRLRKSLLRAKKILDSKVNDRWMPVKTKP